MVAPPLSLPQGYVAYRVDGPVARSSGALTPINNMPAPGFKDVPVGLVLQATEQKWLRPRPFAQSIGTLKPSQTCFKVIEGFRYADEPVAGKRSGGWLPVDTISCPREQRKGFDVHTEINADNTREVSMHASTPPVENSAPALPPPSSRSGWDVGLTTCAVEGGVAKSIQDYIEHDLGFTNARPITELAKRENWIPPANKIFYYRDDAKPVALGMLRALQHKFGWNFEIGKGAGLGLKRGFEGRTLFVHVMSNDC